MQRVLFFLAVFGLAVVMSAPVALAASTEDAKKYASSIGDRVLAVMNSSSTSDDKKLSELETLFVKVVDVDWVGRFVLGRHWRSADEKQKSAYLDAYRDFLIKHYTSRFTEYSGETFVIEQANQRREDEFMVRMNIQRPRGQQPVIVDYMLRAEGEDFKVFDIVVEGVSLINTQRSEFNAAVERQGLDKLTEILIKKTAALTTQTKQDMADKQQ
jgi:phospholipid transport system substrate-binding protein